MRPIAITPLPSLLCKSFVFDWVSTNIANAIDNFQFDNMKSSSTTHCLISLLDFIYKNLEKRKTSVALNFINFKKTFDLVDHNIVLKKALYIGMEPGLVAWLADFLNGRQQLVGFEGTESTKYPLSYGVKQGTKVGPLCFLILINNALTDTPHRWKYVDDSTVGVTVDLKEPNYTHLQQQLDNL